MKRRRIVLALLLLAGLTTLLWNALDWPPPRLILTHGLPPAGGPTGRTWTNDVGIRFVEIAPGYRRVRRRILHSEGNRLGRIGESLGLNIGEWPERDIDSVDRWVEIERPFWITHGLVSRHVLSETYPDSDRYEFLDDDPDSRGYRLPTLDEVWFACDTGALWNIEEKEYEPYVTNYRNGERRWLPLGPGWDGHLQTDDPVAWRNLRAFLSTSSLGFHTRLVRRGEDGR